MSLQTNLERLYGMPLRDILIDLYIKKDMSTTKMAEELQVTVMTVYNWLKKFGITKVKI